MLYFPADPGLLFIVTQEKIQYVHFTESTLADKIHFLLDVDEAHILGMFFHICGAQSKPGKWRTAVSGWLALISAVYVWLLCDGLDLHTLGRPE